MSFKKRYIIRGDEIVGGVVQSIWVVAIAIISIVTRCILNSINVFVKCWRIELTYGTSRKSFILAWNNVGSMWQNMMGATCGSESTRFSTKLSLALRSPYTNYERSSFSMSLSKLNSWFSFGSSLEYSSLL